MTLCKELIAFLAVTSLVTGEGWTRSVTGSLSAQSGNTDLSAYSLAANTKYQGDLIISGRALRDTELTLALTHNRGQLNDALYKNDASLIFLFDVMANEQFSPFFLSHLSYDSTTALDRRIQAGVGAKYHITMKGSPLGEMSVSAAFLWEIQKYRNTNADRQYRWSIRPKYKKSFEGGTSINYLVFYQPLAADPANFLIDSQLTVTVPTKSERVSITFTRVDKHNSTPPSGVKPSDSTTTVGITVAF